MAITKKTVQTALWHIEVQLKQGADLFEAAKNAGLDPTRIHAYCMADYQAYMMMPTVWCSPAEHQRRSARAYQDSFYITYKHGKAWSQTHQYRPYRYE